MTKTDDGKNCYNPLHEARTQAAKELKILLRHIGAKIEHIYTEKCSYDYNQGWD